MSTASIMIVAMKIIFIIIFIIYYYNLFIYVAPFIYLEMKWDFKCFNGLNAHLKLEVYKDAKTDGIVHQNWCTTHIPSVLI